MTRMVEDLLVTTSSVSGKATAGLIDAALDAVAAAEFEGSVAVVDTAGALRGFARTDGAHFLTIELSVGKAWTAASLGYPTHVWNRLMADPSHAPMGHLPRVVAVGGGYPLRLDGRLVGAIGVSGGRGEQDQEAAIAAMGAVGFDTP